MTRLTAKLIFFVIRIIFVRQLDPTWSKLKSYLLKSLAASSDVWSHGCDGDGDGIEGTGIWTGSGSFGVFVFGVAGSDPDFLPNLSVTRKACVTRTSPRLRSASSLKLESSLFFLPYDEILWKMRSRCFNFTQKRWMKASSSKLNRAQNFEMINEVKPGPGTP